MTDPQNGPQNEPQNLWLRETGGQRGPQYAERFRTLAASGQDVHGEAKFVDALLPGPSRVLDAGCGTGRVGIELARLGHEVVGVDLDVSMLAEARSERPDLTWVHADLVALDVDDLGVGPFDLVIAAGNVIVYLTPGTEATVVAAMAAVLAPGGLLVAGFAHDRHVDPAAYDGWCVAAGLEPVNSYAGWDDVPSAGCDVPPPAGGGYGVHVHRQTGNGPDLPTRSCPDSRG